jgi:hypothetical protein
VLVADGSPPQPLSHGEVVARIATVMLSLVPSDRRVIELVLADPKG